MSKQTLAGLLLAIVLVTLSNSVYVIRETERGVLKERRVATHSLASRNSSCIPERR